MACRYQKDRGDAYTQDWLTQCGHTVQCELPEVVGICFIPFPNADGQIYCRYCGKKIRLAEKPIEKDTFEGWKSRGFHVMRGQRSTSRNDDGIALFTDEQVAKNEYRTPALFTMMEDDYDIFHPY